MRRILSQCHSAHSHSLGRRHLHCIGSARLSAPQPLRHHHRHRLSLRPPHSHSNATATSTATTATRNLSDRKSGSFSPPPKEKKRARRAAEDESPQILHSRATAKTLHSSSKTRTVNGRTETVQKKVVSHHTRIKHGDNEVEMTCSQQMERRSESDHLDPSKTTARTTTQSHKRMDIKSPGGSDSHTEISTAKESVSPAEESEVEELMKADAVGRRAAVFEAASQRDFDIFSVGNPSESEVEWRRATLTPHAVVVHPDRLLPVLHEESQRRQHPKGWRHWRRRIKETLTSVRERIVGNETYSEYSQKIKERSDTLRDAYDSSQNYHLVQMRGILDRLNMQTEASKAMEIMQSDLGDFWVEDFLPAFNELLCPLIVRAYLNDDLEFLSTVCVGEAMVFCKNMIEQRVAENKMLAPDILWLHDADLIDTKLHQKRPQLIIRAEVQCIDCVYERGSDRVLEGSPSTVATNIFMMVLEPNLDEKYAQIVPLPWQVRSLSTARQRQIV